MCLLTGIKHCEGAPGVTESSAQHWCDGRVGLAVLEVTAGGAWRVPGLSTPMTLGSRKPSSHLSLPNQHEKLIIFSSRSE